MSSDQLQKMKLISRQIQDQDYVSLIKELTDPHLVWLKMDDVENNPDYVYFFIYSMGRTKNVIWGVYLKKYNKIFLDGGCRYRVQNIYQIQQYWKAHGYSYTSNSVLDRFSRKIALMTDLNPSLSSKEQYLKNKYLVAYWLGKISEEVIYEKYPDIIGLVEKLTDYELEELVQDAADEIKQYEKLINRHDSVGGLAYETKEIIEQIHNYIVTENFDWISLNACPTLQECNTGLGDLCGVYYHGTAMASDRDIS